MIIVPVEKKVDWKRPPIVLILLVAMNILVFVFYQSGDQLLLSDAVKTYERGGLVKKEWAAYKAYSRRRDLPFEIDESDPNMPWYMVMDSGFDRFMEKNHRHYISRRDHDRWRATRDQVERLSSEISITAYGLDSSDIKLVQLITHQFLHGGVMHILGNMVFLILTGFAVEAALGSLRFFGFYILSGIASGLLFSLFATSGGNLVGASGAISGVMAMYVVLFRMHKIRFFYWFFIFTGYVRAAAIIMLPFYIGYELYNYFTNVGSNVAYTAHIGGFLAGAALVYITQNINKSAIDEQYIEGADEAPDPFSQSLTKLYSLIAQCEFKRAWETLKPLKESNPHKEVLVEIEHNLVRALHPNKLDDYLLHRMDKPGNNKFLVKAQIHLWQSFTGEQRSKLSLSKKSGLLQNALDNDALGTAENVFKEVVAGNENNIEVAMLAKRIAVYCEAASNRDKTSKYNQLAAKFAQTNGNSSEAGSELDSVAYSEARS